MRKFIIALGALAVVGIALPATTSTRAEEAKIVVGGDRDRDRDHDRNWRRHHHRDVVVIKHRRHRDRDHD